MKEKRYEDRQLATWGMNQRQNYKKGKLSKEKIEQLKNLDFKFALR